MILTHRVRCLITFATLCIDNPWVHFSNNKVLTMTAKNIPSITIESPFGDPGLNIHCPICGQEVANNKGLNLCEHCLAAFYEGELIDFNDLGEEIF